MSKNGTDIIADITGIVKRHDNKRLSLSPKRKPFPFSAFPGIIAELIEDYSRKTGFPPDYMGGAILSTFSGVAGNNFKIELKDGWTEPALLWIALVGDPGTNKTQCINLAMEPLWEIEERMQEQYERALQDWELHEKGRKETGAEAQPRPMLNQVIIQDATMEALCAAHKYNTNGLLQYADELIGWINAMNQYRRGSDGEKWLQIYNNGRIRVNRKSDEPYMIKNASVSVVGGIQPEVIKDLAKENRRGNGFVNRILYCMPESYNVQPFESDSINRDLLIEYGRALQAVHFTRIDSPRILPLHPKARREYAGWHALNAEMMEASNDNSRRQVYSKLSGQLARVALVLQIMKMACQQSTGNVIEQETVKEAIQIIEYFRFTSCSVCDAIDQEANPKIRKAASLLKEKNTYESVSTILNISKGTITKWKKKFPELFESE